MLATKGYFDVSMASDELNGALVLETTLRATQGGNRAIAVSLAATSFYADAIEKSAPADRPEGQPRGGTLELWQRTAIGVGGSESELAEGMSNAVSNMLKDFFGLFIESRN